MILLTQILIKVKSEYTLKIGQKFEPPFFMDDFKIFATNEREVNGLVSTLQRLKNDTDMKFRMKKCGVLV